jgi:hypothetical protein
LTVLCEAAYILMWTPDRSPSEKGERRRCLDSVMSEAERRQEDVDAISGKLAILGKQGNRTKGVAQVREYFDALFWYWHVFFEQPVTITDHPDGREPSGPVISFFRACAGPVLVAKDRRAMSPYWIKEYIRRKRRCREEERTELKDGHDAIKRWLLSHPEAGTTSVDEYLRAHSSFSATDGDCGDDDFGRETRPKV